MQNFNSLHCTTVSEIHFTNLHHKTEVSNTGKLFTKTKHKTEIHEFPSIYLSLLATVEQLAR